MIPSETSLFIIAAVISSHVSLSAIKSPNDDILSVPLALAYAVAMAESSSPSMSSTKQAFLSSSDIGTPTAADVGLTCLKEVAAGLFNIFFIS